MTRTRTMQNRLSMQKSAATILAGLLCVQVSLADPLHKKGGDGAYVHEGSGWIFPRSIGGFERVGMPYTIDGNNDVGAEYASLGNGLRRTATVDVYYADSAASGANLDSARAALQGRAGALSEVRFAIDPSARITGIKVTATTGSGSSQAALYFFQTRRWVVTVRTQAQGTDTEAVTALDELVRTLRWDTLDTDPGNLHGG